MKSKARRKKAHHSSHKLSMLLISMILLLLSCVLGVNAITLQARNRTFKQQEAELLAQIEEQKQRAVEIEEYQLYVNTEDYIKRIAEEKLGLVDPNEIIFRPVD